MRQLVESARQGSIRAASRLISLLEDNPALLPELFAGMASWPQPRIVVGLTGAPGVGKSTLVDALLAGWRQKNPDKMLGVIAVDPSSPFTGGAVLGDRIRMMDHALDEKIFIRSLASRGHLGGLTLGIKGAVRVMGLMGCDIVLIETVGVGQSEVEVAGVADMTVIALAPGHGDGVQLLKAGLMEAGDVFVVNKADRPGAEKLYSELLATLSITGLIPDKQNSHEIADALHHTDTLPETSTEVFKVSAAERSGIEALVDGLEDWSARHQKQIALKRQNAVRDEVRNAIFEAARQKLSVALGMGEQLENRINSILSGQTNVNRLTEELMKTVLAKS